MKTILWTCAVIVVLVVLSIIFWQKPYIAPVPDIGTPTSTEPTFHPNPGQDKG